MEQLDGGFRRVAWGPSCQWPASADQRGVALVHHPDCLHCSSALCSKGMTLGQWGEPWVGPRPGSQHPFDPVLLCGLKLVGNLSEPQ